MSFIYREDNIPGFIKDYNFYSCRSDIYTHSIHTHDKIIKKGLTGKAPIEKGVKNVFEKSKIYYLQMLCF